MAKRSKATIDTGAYDYKVIKIRGKDGKLHYSRGNADAVAKAMLLHLANGGTVEQIIKANKLEISAKGTNAGLVRMTVGGVLRGRVRNGQEIKIGHITVKSLKQHVELPKVEGLDRPKAKKAKAKSAKPARKQSRRSAPKPTESPEPMQDAA